VKSHEELGVDPRLGVFSPTTLQTFLDCPRKFYLSHFRGLTKTTESIDLAFGASFHVGVGTFYSSGDKEGAVEAFVQDFNKKKVLSNEKKNMETGVLTLQRYVDFYSVNESYKFDPTYIETDFALDMPNGTRLVGIIDRVRKFDGYVVLVDTKTTGSKPSDWYFKKYENDFQMSAYAYALKQLTGECDAVEIDAVQIPYKTADSFQRKTFFRTDLQLSNWLNTYLKVTDFIRAHLSLSEEEFLRAYYQNQNSCSDYGGCKYLGACMHGMNHPSLQAEFASEEGE